ncbi:deoxynucleotidyltransferase terminal-interacting protein 2 [Rhodnius prolixus]|uniref:Fcf2 domain-containing protein n=1 Tax=Rhodnius prolixus TaxID=13249 RepID=T1I5E0_RHOPR
MDKTKEKEYTIDDGYVSFDSDQSALKHVVDIDDIMKMSNIPIGNEKYRELPGFTKKNHKNKEVELSEELLTNVKVLQMRSVYDKKRFYKKNDIKPSKDIQIGRVVDSPADFYSSRLPKKSRKKTLVDELLNDAMFKKEIKKAYVKIVNEKKTNPVKYKRWKKKMNKNRNKTF